MSRATPDDERDGPRLDKWLWAARFFKTRSLAAEAITKGKVTLNGLAAKPAREVRIGDCLAIVQGDSARVVHVRGLGSVRGPARIALEMYEESAESIAARERALLQRRLAPEPAASIAQGRPTKRDRRDLGRAQAQWQRWSASIDDS